MRVCTQSLILPFSGCIRMPEFRVSDHSTIHDLEDGPSLGEEALREEYIQLLCAEVLDNVDTSLSTLHFRDRKIAEIEAEAREKGYPVQQWRNQADDTMRKSFCGECGKELTEENMWSEYTCKDCAKKLG